MSPVGHLTSAMRSCLLRAARKRLGQLHEDYDAMGEHGDVGADKEKLFAEIACVTEAIRWLWLQPTLE